MSGQIGNSSTDISNSTFQDRTNKEGIELYPNRAQPKLFQYSTFNDTEQRQRFGAVSQ